MNATLSQSPVTQNEMMPFVKESAIGVKGAILVVAYHWPPDASVGAIRPVKLAKYLGQHGWKTVALTVEAHFYEELDSRVGDESHQCLAVRTRCLASPLTLYGWAKGSILRLLGREREFQLSKLGATAEKAGRQVAEGLLGKVKRVILAMFLIPDQYLGWLPFAVLAGVRAVRTHHIRSVISTGPPFTAHLIGLSLKTLCKVPWVADFRDPWTDNEQKASHIKSRLAEALDRWLESLVVRHADFLVCVTPAMTEKYVTQYPTIPPQKFVTISNGFDEEEFKEFGAVRREDKFTITYTGRFDYGRSPEMLLQALEQLIQEGQIDRQALAVRFIGRCRYAGGRSVEEMVVRNRLEGVVEITDLIPRQEALEAMRQAHVLVLLAEQQVLQVPAKAYEYIAAGGHILAFTERRGATADLIGRVGGGMVVSPEDLAPLKRTLKQWFDDARNPAGNNADRTFCDPIRVREYEWSEIGAQYAALLEKKLGE